MPSAARAELEALLIEASDLNDEGLMAEVAAELDALDHEEAQAAKSDEFVNILDLEPTEAPRRMPAPIAPTTGNPALDAFDAMRRSQRDIAAPDIGPENPDEQFHIEEAAKQGVDVSTGLAPSTRALAGLIGGHDGEEGNELLGAVLSGLVERDLREQGFDLPDDVPAIDYEQNTGKLAYLRPTAAGKLKPTLVNPPGADFGDALMGIDQGVGMAVEAGGALVGGALAASAGPAAPVAYSVIAGAGGGAAANVAVNFARRELARAFGVPDELADAIDSDYLLDEALYTAGGELAGPAAMGLFKKMRNAYRPIENDVDTDRILKDVAEIRRKTEELQRRTGVRLTTPTLGQASGDARIRGIEKEAEMGAIGNSSSKMNRLNFERQAGIVDAIKVIQERHVPVGTPMPTSSDRYTARQLMFNRKQIAEDYEAAVKKDLGQLADSVSHQISTLDYRHLQEEARSGLAKMKAYEDAAWNNFRAQVETDPVTTRALVLLNNPPDSPINQAARHLIAQRDAALSESLKKAKDGLLKDWGYKEDAVSENMLSGGALDVNHVHELLSHLKQSLRVVERGTEPSGWKKDDLIAMIGAVEKQLNEGSYVRVVPAPFGGGTAARPLGEERTALVRESYQVAKDATLRKHNAFREEAAKDLFTLEDRDGPVFSTPALVRKRVLTPGDTTTLDNLLDIVDSKPSVRYALVRDIETMYRASVFTDKGVPLKAEHERFMEAYAPHLQRLIGAEQTDFITNAQTLRLAVEKAERNTERVTKAMKNAFGTRFNPENEARDTGLINDMLDGKLSIGSIRAARKAIVGDGGAGDALWASLQRESLELLKGKFLKQGQKEGNLRALQEALDGPQRERLEVIFGPEYVTDLKLARDILETLYEPESAAKRNEINTPAIKVFRSIFGPLSPLQRRITAGQNLSEALKKKRAAAIIFSPDDLHRLVKFAKTPPGGFAAAQAAIGAGLALNDMPPELQESVTTVQKMNERRKQLGYTVDPISEVQRLNNAR